MDNIFKKMLATLEKAIEHYEQDNGFELDKLKIKVIGQYALLLNPDAKLDQLDLAATNDVDAMLTGPFPVIKELKEILRKNGLEYDMDSEKIWLPKDHTVFRFYTSPKIVVDIVDPISIIISKAVKAKEKNKKLISQAIDVFGDQLITKLQKEGADLAYFQTS